MRKRRKNKVVVVIVIAYHKRIRGELCYIKMLDHDLYTRVLYTIPLNK